MTYLVTLFSVMHNKLVTLYYTKRTSPQQQYSVWNLKFCLFISKSSHLRHVEVNCTWQSIFLHRYCWKKLNFELCKHSAQFSLTIVLRWLTTVLMEYKSTIFNSFEKGSKLFFPSLFNACLSLLPFYVKFEQLNVNKWPKWATEHPMRDWALVG